MPQAIAFGGAGDLTFAKQAYADHKTGTCLSHNHDSFGQPKRVVLRKRCLGPPYGCISSTKQESH